MRRPIRLLLAAAFLGLAAPARATEIVPAEKRVIPYAANLPVCGDPSVLATISDRFAEKEVQYWKSDLTIVQYDAIRPVAWRPWGLDTIPRRYCTAAATASDGKRRQIDYSVREDLDFLGVGWGVEWCVSGLDRNLAYSPACKMARP